MGGVQIVTKQKVLIGPPGALGCDEAFGAHLGG